MKNVDRNQREMRIITVVALCVAVICLSVAYAAMSETLKVGGSAKMTGADWNVHFANVSASTTGVATYTMPSISSTQLHDFGVVLTKPGDSVTFRFDIMNDGNLDAVLGTLTKSNPECSSLTSEEDGTIVCNNLVYKLSYEDDTAVEVGDTLTKKTYKSAKLVLAYKENATEVPSSTVNIKNLDITFIFNQG